MVTIFRILSAVSCAKTAEPTEMHFGMLSRVDQRIGVHAHWRNLVNTTESSV